MYTANVQQIDRTYLFRDKGEKEWKEVGAREENNTYLKQVHQTKTIKQQVNKTKKTQTYNKHIKSTKSILL